MKNENADDIINHAELGIKTLKEILSREKLIFGVESCEFLLEKIRNYKEQSKLNLPVQGNVWVKGAVNLLKEVLPIAERMQDACSSGETKCYDNEYDMRDSVSYQQTIDKIKVFLNNPETPLTEDKQI